MKLLIAFASIAFLLLANTCNNQNFNPNSMEITGIIEPVGITTCQYVTHTISTDDEFYALRSEKIDLAKYEGKKITIMGEKIEGYPLDNGPVFVEVKEIIE